MRDLSGRRFEADIYSMKEALGGHYNCPERGGGSIAPTDNSCVGPLDLTAKSSI